MKEKVAIVHVVHRFDTGGLENGMVNLINRLDPSVYRHSIVTMKGHSELFAERIKTDNVTFYDLAKGNGQDLGIFLRLNRLLKTLRPDVLHTRNTATLEMQLVGWWRRVPLRIHGEHGWDVNDMHGSNPRYQKLRRFMRRFVHQWVALSVEARDYLLNTIGVAPERVNHICNGVDIQRFSPQPSTDSDSLVVGCVGRLAAVKNHTMLATAFVDAWHYARERNTTLKLHLIGDGDCRGAVEKILIDGGCIKDCWLAGNRSDVPDLMGQMDVFVLPSLAEGISNTILEAMASGLPVVATAVGGNVELVQHEQSGFLVDVDAGALATALKRYVDEPALIQQQGQCARQLAEEKFSIDAMTAAYDGLYRSH
ncbi:TIGR03088 family PEP-CTERM/XrtA system glycosyltransferase [Aestuariibacter halophilus]|uniref:TIGR03088 family PEP-CTERM/XrtA system glycosyltransferase n=1 Tax=Fluctibacter halophilus TaxID=226011 RepID=A0ABS8G316_9ALTE|nr:TIGR03088 family PEP-CTERM/XrtA system glycosyltransferase [Aestuariibacter halophilus]MCC2614858.1 TIGR03088 family PEP-CTERM/XrtA system glycosyltransferase [Aestuariibacter halophilus]